MLILRTARILLACALPVLASEPAFPDAYLGPAPWLDPEAPPREEVTAGPKVVVPVPPINTASRAAVVAAYNTYYNLPAPAVGFSGSTASCTPGTISRDFQEWTLSRINFLRAMAGVSGSTTLDSSVDAQEQAAALIMAANNTLNHSPPNTYLCWSQAGATGAGSSNLALGTQLVDSIPLYMSDFGSGNLIVGHRRWILHSRKNSFGLGQANGSSFNANALYVFQQGAAVSIPDGIPWPPRGYVPVDIFPAPLAGEGQRWSFGIPNANFAAAGVTMKLNGSPLAVTIRSRTDNGYGDNSIVWELPPDLLAAKGAVYDVTISGVSASGSSTYSYQTIAIDPAEAPPPQANNYTALWWNPAESGWGLNLNHQGDILFGTLFTYDASGVPMWLVMSSGNLQSGTTYTGTLYRTTGPAFNANPFTPIGAANLTAVGGMTLTFSGSNAATISYSVNGVSVTKSIQRQVFGSRAADCTATTASRAALTNYQDLWWNAAESGWGVNLTHQDNTIFATLFTYDATGKGLWLVMSAGQRQADGSYAGNLYRTTGPAFNANPFPPIGAGNITAVGTMILRFLDGNNGTLAYTYEGTSVFKSITRQVFSSPVPACN